MTQTALNPKVSSPVSDWKKWLGVFPFFLFAILFLVLPSLRLIIGSFTNNEGQFTFANLLQLFQEKSILDAYWLSIRISAATAIGSPFHSAAVSNAVTRVS